jgi:hypothetical protein
LIFSKKFLGFVSKSKALMEIFRLFLTDCLLFKSPLRVNRILGFFAWCSILLFVYSVVQLVRL